MQSGSGLVPIPEPYFSVLLVVEEEKEVEHGYYVSRATGQSVPYAWGKEHEDECRWMVESTRKVRTGKKVNQVNPGPWVMVPDEGVAMTSLVGLTGSRTPLVRADWLLTYFLQAPGYYTLLGLNVTPGAKFTDALKGASEEDWEKLLGVDDDLAAKTRIQEVADTRIVTLHNRILDRIATANSAAGGYFWKSIDTDNGIDLEDYLNHFQDFFQNKGRRRGGTRNGKLVFQAQEYYASLPNGLHATALTDNQGDLLNVAVQTVANDTRSAYARRLGDTNVVCYRNCLVCHDKEGGLWPIEAEVRPLSTGDSRLGIVQRFKGTKYEDVARTIANAYGGNIDGIVKLDASRYAAAVAEATKAAGRPGRTPRENALAYEALTVAYLGDLINLAAAETETGVSRKELLALLRPPAPETTVNLDHTLVGLAKLDQVPARRLHWERQGYAQLMTLVATQRPDLLVTPAVKGGR